MPQVVGVLSVLVNERLGSLKEGYREYLNLKIMLLMLFAKVVPQVVRQVSSRDNIPAAMARHNYLDHIGQCADDNLA